MGLTAAVAFGIGASYLQGENSKNMANYQNRIAQANADMANFQAKQNIIKGEKDAAAYKRKASAMIGEQRATFAGSNVAVDSGTAAAIQDSTEMIAAEDIRTIKNNATLAAFGLNSQALNYKFQGQAGIDSANNAVLPGLISGGMQGFVAGGGFKGKAEAPTPKTSADSGLQASSGYLGSQPTGDSGSYLGSKRYDWG